MTKKNMLGVRNACSAYMRSIWNLCMHTARTQSSILESTACPNTDLLIFLLYFVSQLVPNLRIYNLTKNLCLRASESSCEETSFSAPQTKPGIECCCSFVDNTPVNRHKSQEFKSVKCSIIIIPHNISP